MPTVETQDSLTSLSALDRVALAKQWSAVFGCPAPRNCHATLLRGALAWHCQIASYGKAGTAGNNRVLRKLQQSVSASGAGVSLTPGTRLLREWQGQTHHVTVSDNGFEYAGNTYRSLTAITRLITGTPWSGPQFFGLRS
jgi:Protein of unknown function (DUF2924)